MYIFAIFSQTRSTKESKTPVYSVSSPPLKITWWARAKARLLRAFRTFQRAEVLMKPLATLGGRSLRKHAYAQLHACECGLRSNGWLLRGHGSAVVLAQPNWTQVHTKSIQIWDFPTVVLVDPFSRETKAAARAAGRGGTSFTRTEPK